VQLQQQQHNKCQRPVLFSFFASNFPALIYKLISGVNEQYYYIKIKYYIII